MREGKESLLLYPVPFVSPLVPFQKSASALTSSEPFLRSEIPKYEPLPSFLRPDGNGKRISSTQFTRQQWPIKCTLPPLSLSLSLFLHIILFGSLHFFPLSFLSFSSTSSFLLFITFLISLFSTSFHSSLSPFHISSSFSFSFSLSSLSFHFPTYKHTLISHTHTHTYTPCIHTYTYPTHTHLHTLF